MALLRERQRGLGARAEQARRRLAEKRNTMEWMSAASARRSWEDQLAATWRGGPTVLAFVFGHPDSLPMRLLDERGDYFDIRSGDNWDLFFPGYYESNE